MPSKLVDALAKLAEAQKPLCDPRLDSADEDGDTYCRYCGVGIHIGEQRHCDSRPNVLAALHRRMKWLESVKDAAKALEKHLRQTYSSVSAEISPTRVLLNVLDAALSNEPKE